MSENRIWICCGYCKKGLMTLTQKAKYPEKYAKVVFDHMSLCKRFAKQPCFTFIKKDREN